MMESEFLSPKDYRKIVVDGFKYPDSDLADYYASIRKKYLEANPRLNEKIESAFLWLINWHTKHVENRHAEKLDAAYKHAGDIYTDLLLTDAAYHRIPVYGFDEKGNKIEKNFIVSLQSFGVNKSILITDIQRHLEIFKQFECTMFNSQTFFKTPTEQKTIGSKGGKARSEKSYRNFCEWINAKNFSILSYKDVSNVNFMKALVDRGFKISEKTAGIYKKRYLSELEKESK